MEAWVHGTVFAVGMNKGRAEIFSSLLPVQVLWLPRGDEYHTANRNDSLQFICQPLMFNSRCARHISLFCCTVTNLPFKAIMSLRSFRSINQGPLASSLIIEAGLDPSFPRWQERADTKRSDSDRSVRATQSSPDSAPLLAVPGFAARAHRSGRGLIRCELIINCF